MSGMSAMRALDEMSGMSAMRVLDEMSGMSAMRVLDSVTDDGRWGVFKAWPRALRDAGCLPHMMENLMDRTPDTQEGQQAGR